MKYCPVCETDYPDDVTVCPQDGAAVRRPGERPDPFVGRVIKGRYRVERQLGRGGMGTVYLAEQLSVGRKVALKVLRGDFAREEGFVARFQQEAKLVAGLNERRNPRVTLVHDFDKFPELYRSLIVDRNRKWADEIGALLDDDANYLIVVGALHLVGQDSVIELLRAHGHPAQRQ